MRTALSVFTAATLLFSNNPLLAEESEPTLFEGAWVMSAKPDEAAAGAGYQPFSDELLFHDGQMSAGALAMLGFAPDTFATSDAGGFPSFLSMLVSSDRGQIVFNGRIESDKLVGSIVWLRPSGESTRYTLTAERLGW